VALAAKELLITGAEAEEFTVITNVAEPVPELFVAEIVTFEVPATVGVPVIAPVDVLMPSPPGNPVAP
jgi:hypothetical protein